MDTVGDGADGHLFDGNGGEELLEHEPARVAVQLGNPVGHVRQPQAHHGHVERGVCRLARRMAEVHEVADADAAFMRPAGEVLLHELRREPVDSRRNRRVGCEHRAGPGDLQRLRERKAFARDELAYPFQAQEPRVAFVRMEDLGLFLDGVESPDAADTEKHLLAEAVLGPTAVEAVGHAAGIVGVLLDVGVEHVQLDAPHVGDPDLGDEGLAGEVDGDPESRLSASAPWRVGP